MMNKDEKSYQELSPNEIREQSKGKKKKISIKEVIKMNEEYMSMAEVRKLLAMPKYEFTDKQVREALKQYNKSNDTNIILIEEQ